MATDSFEDIVSDFDFLDDWEDRYRYVIELGKKMAPLPEPLRTSATKVDGCASQVWIVPRLDGEGASAKFDFEGDSDAMIVRGLIAILHELYAGLTVEEVVGVDAPHELGRLGLDQHLSSQRSNGLRAMIGRIRSIAGAAAEQV
ncbi:SufE family protein [Amaricoccus macauensis]|uniref:SufE family protein n=1 Tax=Amaricoccus macauensis TaxID=57001 RepID=UPI003C7AFA9C